MTSEWDNTPWAGSPVLKPIDPPLPALKAVYGGSYLNVLQSGPLLNSLLQQPQQRAAAFLRAYKVGWFHKAERKISGDIAGLDWSISDGDIESEDPNERVIAKPDLDIPFDALNPIEQLIRLLERPNPYQTGKQLVQKLQIRHDMAGAAFLYLENGQGGGLPTALYGISPSRMWEARDRSNTRIGWIMDKDSQNPVPFDVDEIIPFPMPSEDDDDVFGVGVVESVYSELPLSDLFARHTGDLMTTGGRLAGMMWPKERPLDENEFQDARRAWQNVASDPNAARRLLIFPEPMEWSSGSSTPAEIGIPELSALNRDNILTAFPISPYQLGVPMPGGLNSGETRRQDRKDYWEGTIHPRVDDLEEMVQVHLLSRYEQVMGQTFDFEIEEPNLDDAESIIQKVAAYKDLIQSGFDDTEARAAAGLDHIKYIAVPDLMDPVKQAAAAAQAAQAQQATTTTVTTGNRGIQESTSAQSKTMKTRDGVAQAYQSSFARFLGEQRSRVMDAIRKTYPQAKANRKGWATKADPEWWDGALEDAELTKVASGLYQQAGRDSLQGVADRLDRLIQKGYVQHVLEDLLAKGGERITAINTKTRDAIQTELVLGASRGYSINQITDGVPEEKYGGVQNALLDNGVPAFDSYRAEMIARSETMLSYNRAAVTSYGEFGVREVQAIDGDGDEECAARDGQTFSVDDALDIADHPNGTLDWIPVLDKAVHEPMHQDIKVAPVFNLTIPPTVVKAGDVTVEPPVVNVTNEVATPSVTVQNDVQTPVVTVRNDVKTPSVTVEAPVVNVAAPDIKAPVNVTVPAELRITSMPDRVTSRKVKREAGLITETVEVETDG